MKQKRHRYRNRMLAIKGNALFSMRVERPKKGKGSYRRSKRNGNNDLLVNTF